MARTLVPGLLALALALSWQPAPLCAADDGAELVGVWEGQLDGHKEVWTINNQNGRWTASGVYQKNGKQVGSAAGQNPKYADGVLTFTQKLVKIPAGVTWIDGATITIKPAKDKLSYTWDVGGLSGAREWTRVGDVPAPTTTTSAVSPVGSWQGVVDGITEVWTIKNDNGDWTVSGVYMKDGQPVGSFTGKDPKFNNNTLTFTHSIDKKPDGVGWIDGSTISASVKNGKLDYHWHNGKNKGVRLLEPAK
jgi:hypothetical protein